ncbi:hypothetical protein HMPREF9599_01600 [Cutibacterium acnes HL050PA2]|nr:hypothetical protein HMPREF9599_01600 [Cutibacterium acnes HL050PA2]
MPTSYVTTLSTCTAYSSRYVPSSLIERAEDRGRHNFANSG